MFRNGVNGIGRMLLIVKQDSLSPTPIAGAVPLIAPTQQRRPDAVEGH